jgi:hypothetical protein
MNLSYLFSDKQNDSDLPFPIFKELFVCQNKTHNIYQLKEQGKNPLVLALCLNLDSTFDIYYTRFDLSFYDGTVVSSYIDLDSWCADIVMKKHITHNGSDLMIYPITQRNGSNLFLPVMIQFMELYSYNIAKHDDYILIQNSEIDKIIRNLVMSLINYDGEDTWRQLVNKRCRQRCFEVFKFLLLFNFTIDLAKMISCHIIP